MELRLTATGCHLP